MATSHLLTDLADMLRAHHGTAVEFRSAGGVEVAGWVRDGVDADLVVLGASTMNALGTDGLLVPGTLRAMYVSDVVAAVPATSTPPPLESEVDLRSLLESAVRIAYSTGPSGTALLELVERWRLATTVGDRLVQAAPGVPVGSLLANGEADLGFQQRSELAGLPGVAVLGPLPGGAAIRSTFAGAVLTTSPRHDSAARALDLLCAEAVSSKVREHGMELARHNPG